MKNLFHTPISVGLSATLLLAVSVSAFLTGGCTKKVVAPGAECVPETTLFYADAPDLSRTSDRWPKLALAGILGEPEVKAFLEKPLSKGPIASWWQQWGVQLQKLNPRSGFFAVTSMEGPEPTFVARIDCRGNRADLEQFVKGLRDELTKAVPDGKSDLGRYKDATIQTYATDHGTLATSIFRDGILFANNVDLLKKTIDLSAGAKGEPVLASNSRFKETMAQVGKEADFRGYIQLAPLIERLGTILTASGKANENDLAELKKYESVGIATSLDGANFRDRVYVRAPGLKQTDPLTGRLLALNATETLVYFDTRFRPEAFNKEALSTTPGGEAIVETVDSLLALKGLNTADLGTLFEPELAFLLDWNPESMQPNFGLAVPVNDREKAWKVLEALAAVPLPDAKWEVREEGNTASLVYSGMQLQMVSPTFTLGPKELIFGLNPDANVEMANRSSADPKPEKNPAYKTARGMVPEPSSSFAFVDSKVLFDKTYSLVRPMLMTYGIFNPKLSEWIDLGKLPATETISHHLGPIAHSVRTTPDGVLIESAGPVTLHQATLILAGAVGGIAAPAMSQLSPGATPGLNFLNPSAPARNTPPSQPQTSGT